MASTHAARHVRLTDAEGLHFRSAARLSQRARGFTCDIRITYADCQTNAKSILGPLSLIAEPECDLKFAAEGPQSEEALDQLEHLVSNRFDDSAKEGCHENA